MPLRVVTPILGGAATPRSLDDHDALRVPSVRGQLRFWWRCLHARGRDGASLHAAERSLWGGAAGAGGTDDGASRSPVEVSLVIHERGTRDEGNPSFNTLGFYALWPARGPRGQDPAPRRRPGTRFTLTVRCPTSCRREVEDAVRAWILFGGYGGRTRRGCGSLTLAADATVEHKRPWLPAAPTLEAIAALFAIDLFGVVKGAATETPSLVGARLVTGTTPTRSAEAAWDEALHWLKDFRQEEPPSGQRPSHDATFARERGSTPIRAGRSNWPEADKIRHIARLPPGRSWWHPPLHNAAPVFPRAGFGLPIVGQFQTRDRNNNPVNPLQQHEPGGYEIKWRPASHSAEGGNRLASPLLVKALPLADGSFVPCALWLRRAFPAGEIVVEGRGIPTMQRGAPFDLLVAPGDTARFTPLAAANASPQGERLRDAFLMWLLARPGVAEVK